LIRSFGRAQAIDNFGDRSPISDPLALFIEAADLASSPLPLTIDTLPVQVEHVLLRGSHLTADSDSVALRPQQKRPTLPRSR
jgi:hypothetical protein